MERFGPAHEGKIEALKKQVEANPDNAMMVGWWWEGASISIPTSSSFPFTKRAALESTVELFSILCLLYVFVWISRSLACFITKK